MKRSARFLVRILFGVLLPLVVLVAGVYAAIKLMESGPEAERRQRTREARLVEVAAVQAADRRVILSPMGPVKAARSIQLQSRISGSIVEVAEEFIPGGHFEAGEVMLRVDPADFKLRIRQRETEVATAEAALRIEMGQQEVALREYELLGESIQEGDREWVLRQPQLRNAQAQLDAARANLELAKLELDRTAIKAPFNCIVLNRNVNLGMQVGVSTMLAELADTDRFWLELAVPVDDLRWIEIPRFPGDRGSEVRVRNEAAWGPDRHRTGRVVRLSGEVDPMSRMATLLVEIEDPLALADANANEPVLLLNSYIRAEVLGREIQNVIAIGREYLHEGDTVWVMNASNELEVRKAAVLYRGRDEVLLESGLRDGEQIVTTLLSSPVAGMSLRTQESRLEPSLPAQPPVNEIPIVAEPESRP